MEKFMKAIPKNLRVSERLYIIDNFVFRLHYRYTVSVLIIAMLLISTTELTGEHIKCVQNKGSGVEEKIMNRFCYSMTTFTVVKYLNDTQLDGGHIPHAGVGPIGTNNKDEIKHHAYYQWVFFVFLLQSVLFYLPHLIWKNQEGNRMKKLIAGLHNAQYATTEANDRKIGNQTYPAKATVQKQFDVIIGFLNSHITINRYWALRMISLEWLNFFNLIFNIWLTNIFLGYQFMSLGPKVVNEGLESSVDVLDVVFPKMTKCLFYKYGPSGSMQPIDALCVMALNIFNEKTFVFLWFWYLILFIATSLCIIWRIISMCFYRSSRAFNKLVFSYASSGLDMWQVLSVTQTYSYLDWVFLVYLAKNMDDLVFQDFFALLAKDNMLVDLSRNSTDGDSDDFDEKLINEKLYLDKEKTK